MHLTSIIDEISVVKNRWSVKKNPSLIPNFLWLLVQKLTSMNGTIELLVNWIRDDASITFFNIVLSKQSTIIYLLLQVTFLIGKMILSIIERSFLIESFLFVSLSILSRDSEDTMLLIMKEILRLDHFEPEAQFETIEQMIKSNVLNYFVTNQTTKLNELRPYLAKAESFHKSFSDSDSMETL